jgi:alkane 1-monooxygenase
MLRYSAPFLFLLAIPALCYAGGPAATLISVGVLVAALVGAEFLPRFGGRRGSTPDLFRGRTGGGKWLQEPFRLLPLIYIPLQLAVIAWATWLAATTPLDAITFIALVLSVGIVAGIFGMLAAHEMAHSPRRLHRGFAFFMLMGTGNPQFRIAHIYGHHRYAGTENDAATAHLGETFYGFLLRTLPQQWHEAFAFETRRCERRSRPLYENRALRDALCLAVLYGVLVVISRRGALFLLAESTVAIIVLELFNYIAHYGLLRRRRSDAGHEPLSDNHSWNSSNAVANLLIFNMGRHSDHHRRPATSYEGLIPVAAAPELPAGYAGSILLALVPPLWHRVMNPRVLAIRAQAAPPLDLTA